MMLIVIMLALLATGFLFGWLAKAASLAEFTDYRFVSADCPDREMHAHLPAICHGCGYDPNLPEGERETI